MNTLHLTDSELSSLINACYVARDCYLYDAEDISILADQFKRQAAEIEALAKRIEQ